jgi:hypothetical protein
MSTISQQPLLDAQSTDFDGFEPPPPAPVASRWTAWRGRILSVAGAGASIAVRALNVSHGLNAVASFGAGFFAQSTIESGQKGERLARIRQVSWTLLGQVTLFGLSQWYDNTTSMTAKTVATHAIIAMLGANIHSIGRWLLQQGAIRTESSPTHSDQNNETMITPSPIRYNSTHALKTAVSVASGVSYFFITDPILKGLSSFFASFFGSQVVGERTVDFLDKKIAEKDGPEGTRWRVAKTVLTTLGYVAKPLSFIPWNNPTTPQRLGQLFGVGFGLGFFDGIFDRSQIRRLERIPVKELEEFNQLTPTKSLAERIFKYAVPLISVAGMVGFTIWQEKFVLNSEDSKSALGAMLGGFLASYGVSKVVDYIWKRDERDWKRDRAMVALWASSRILGINPLFIYYAGTNALRMQGSAIDAQSSSHKVMNFLSWIAYGAAMGRELMITSADRVGNLLMKCPQLFLINGCITAKLSATGVDP